MWNKPTIFTQWVQPPGYFCCLCFALSEKGKWCERTWPGGKLSNLYPKLSNIPFKMDLGHGFLSSFSFPCFEVTDNKFYALKFSKYYQNCLVPAQPWALLQKASSVTLSIFHILKRTFYSLPDIGAGIPYSLTNPCLTSSGTTTFF